MRNDPFGRGLVRLRRTGRDLLFRGMVFLGFSLLAFCFSWNYANNNLQNNTNRSADGERIEIDRRIADYTLWAAIGTIVLAISTVGLWGVTWRAGIRQSGEIKDSLRIARRSADAAAISANAAKEQVALAREMGETPLRAYLAVGEIAVDKRSGRVEIQVINRGKTPANSVAYIYRREFSKDDAGYEDDSDSGRYTRQIAPDSDDEFVVFDSDLSLSEGVPVNIWMTIRYRDWFDGVHSCKLSFISDEEGKIADRRYNTD